LLLHEKTENTIKGMKMNNLIFPDIIDSCNC